MLIIPWHRPVRPGACLRNAPGRPALKRGGAHINDRGMVLETPPRPIRLN